jgi:hypothetical protein
MNHNVFIVKSGKYEANLSITEAYIELFYWNNYSILYYNKKTGKVKIDIRGKDDQKLLNKVLNDYLITPLAKTIKSKIKTGE